MAKPTQQQYSYTPIESERVNSVNAARDFAKNMFKFKSEYEDWTDKLVRAKENIVQGVGLPGALLGAYALGNKPKNGGSRLPGVVGAVGGAYLGKTLYDFAANNESTKKYITDFTNFVDKHTGGVGGQYVPMAAQALGGLLGYGLLKQSNYNMYKQAKDSGLGTALKIIGIGAPATAASGGFVFGSCKLGQTADELIALGPSTQQLITNTDRAINDPKEGLVPKATKVVDGWQQVVDDVKPAADQINEVSESIPGWAVTGASGLGIGIPLAIYGKSKRKKNKKKKY